MDYQFKAIEEKWQQRWKNNKVYKVTEDKSKPKYYVLDMFPYPSGAGLHVGHPLGYIASDIFARYKRLKGFNVLHPMGYDAFGLPAEQYAIQTGQHPAITTEQNAKRYREQLDRIGFSFDWEREVRTCDPEYYKWTQYVFTLLFNHYYCNKSQKAQPVTLLISIFEKEGNIGVDAANHCNILFSAQEWKSFSTTAQHEILMCYRLAYRADNFVNWCPALKCVLAHDEVKDGLSVRGGYPVEQRKMMQWNLRISAYAERLLNGLEHLQWSESLKEIQRNWIGRSEGVEMKFTIDGHEEPMTIFTTRADTIFGVTFMVLAPESEWVAKLTTDRQRQQVEQYLHNTKQKTERDRIANTKTVSGVFSGSYAIHPFTKKQIPIWISDYVLAGYGTGAIMAVPAHDSRDYAFAKHFNLPIIPLIEGCDVSKESFDAKEGIVINSDFLNGLTVKKAITTAITAIENQKLGLRKINYRLRDAIFSRQRYWGEPFPVYYKDGEPQMLDITELPLTLPAIDNYLPTSQGEPPLAHAKGWKYGGQYDYEYSTMPGFAGSSAYYLRYMDPHNNNALVDKEINRYWGNVDLYVGGAEHATGHLIYSRFWNKFLFDLGMVCKDEPFQRLINQGMIQGRSNFVYRIKGTNRFVSNNLKEHYDTQELHVDVNIVTNDKLDIAAFKKWRPEFSDAEFITDANNEYICGWAVEKMSKSMFNVVSPDKICDTYGADTLRLYEMFLGPIEMAKPWDTNGIEGVLRFLRKFWRLSHSKEKFEVTDQPPTPEELKILHRLIQKIEADIENFSFNTSVSAFMIAVNELSDLKCNKRGIIEELVVLLSPFAPHIAEELWEKLGHSDSVLTAQFPLFNANYITESCFEYPVSVNGKLKCKISLDLSLSAKEVEDIVKSDETVQRYIQQPVKKIIFVKGKIINIVV